MLLYWCASSLFDFVPFIKKACGLVATMYKPQYKLFFNRKDMEYTFILHPCITKVDRYGKIPTS